MKKFFAFTLSEVLVTLSIVGVISVLTLPNLMSSYQKKVQVASLQRTYNMIVNATAKYMTDNRVDDLSYSDLATIDGVEEFFKKYFDVVKLCSENNGNAGTCLQDTYNKFHRDSTFSVHEQMGDVVCANTNTGAVICLRAFDESGSFAFIDTNGISKPNTAGRDFFGLLNVGVDGKMMGLLYTSEEPCPITSKERFPEVFFATPCFAKIQQDGWEMNY